MRCCGAARRSSLRSPKYLQTMYAPTHFLCLFHADNNCQTGRFKAYEGYGANYDLVQRDIDETQRHISIWPDFDKAIEALSLHVNPTRSQEANKKKAMTVKDLLIKVSWQQA